VSADAPFANLYYTVELPGVYKYIALTSYAPGQTFSHDEEQYQWLEQELSKVSCNLPAHTRPTFAKSPVGGRAQAGRVCAGARRGGGIHALSFGHEETACRLALL
jgi:hypothetical protein